MLKQTSYLNFCIKTARVPSLPERYRYRYLNCCVRTASSPKTSQLPELLHEDNEGVQLANTVPVLVPELFCKDRQWTQTSQLPELLHKDSEVAQLANTVPVPELLSNDGQ
jgi:hypothetical protein